MDKEGLKARVRHLREVEKLSLRQIAVLLSIGRKKARSLIDPQDPVAMAPPVKGVLDQYLPLMAEWYKQYPRLRAKQIYQRLKEYGYKGSYKTVLRASIQWRQRRENAYHVLNFLPGQEAQVDWMFFKHEGLGLVAGFVYILSYSRYAWGVFYPKNTFEFFLSGHLECFKHIGGCARSHRYDNLKSVVIRREPQIQYNAQFLDFARFYGFTIHACNPYSGNEKGRVERLIRDIRVFLDTTNFKDLVDLNKQFHRWLDSRNDTIHRSTQKTPKALLGEERLIPLPQNSYVASRVVAGRVSKTALVEFETNKYSVPSSCVGKKVEVLVYVDRIEIVLAGQTVARHRRCFKRGQTVENPLHAEKLLAWTPKFKSQRILELISRLDEEFNHFLVHQEDDLLRNQAAYQLFILLKTYSKAILVSAVRQLNSMRCFKVKALLSLLNLPQSKDSDPLWPQNKDLLNLNYEERKLTDYDELT